MSDQTNQQQPVQTEPSLSELLQIRRDKLTELQKAGKDPFAITRYDVTHHSSEVKENFEQMEGQTVRLAGRLMSKRGMGKAVFSDLQDGAGRIQLYVRIDDVAKRPWPPLKSTISATSSAWRVRYSAPNGEKSPSRPRPSPCCPSPCCPCRRSSTA